MLYVANNPSASLMQPLPRNSDGGDLQDEEAMQVAPRIPDRFRPGLRRILVQSIVGAIRVIIAQLISCEAVDVAIMDYDHMVLQIVPKTSNPPFGNSRSQHAHSH
jgi:hypothetical protein